MKNLFVYGTLQLPEIQLLVLGRALPGTPDVLDDYEKTTITLESNTYPIIRPKAGTSITGQVLTVTADDLPKLDLYETAAYQRVRVTLRSGLTAWVYCAPT